MGDYTGSYTFLSCYVEPEEPPNIPNDKNLLVMDWGQYGLYTYEPKDGDMYAGYSEINSSDPKEMVVIDFDGDGISNLVGSFEGYGTYLYDNSNGWSQIHTSMPEKMVVFDNILVMDWGQYGLYTYEPKDGDMYAGYTEINSNDPKEMVAIDFDGDGISNLVVSFEGYGTYLYDNSNGWSQIHTSMPEKMVVFDNILAMDWGQYGFYTYEPKDGDMYAGYTKINSNDPKEMVAIDFDGDGISNLVVSFEGNGTYFYDDSNGWNQIHTSMPDKMVVFDNILAMDWGQYGLYTYEPKDGDMYAGYTKINSNDPKEMVAIDFDGDGISNLAASFEGYGTYLYDNSNEWNQIHTSTPEKMITFSIVNKTPTNQAVVPYLTFISHNETDARYDMLDNENTYKKIN